MNRNHSQDPCSRATLAPILLTLLFVCAGVQQWTNCGGAGLTLGSDGNFYGTCVAGNPATGLGST